jgi:hypothetical protein
MSSSPDAAVASLPVPPEELQAASKRLEAKQRSSEREEKGSIGTPFNTSAAPAGVG